MASRKQHRIAHSRRAVGRQSTALAPLSLAATGYRPARARIDLDRLGANYRALTAFAGHVPLMPVVKADAYGHGATVVGPWLEGLGAARVAVAYVEEAVALRRAGVVVPIVVLAGFWPGQEDLIAQHRLVPVVTGPEALTRILALAHGTPRRISVHLTLDTGMSRLGFEGDAFKAAARALANAPGVLLEGLMTHLAVADEDTAATARQLDRFDAAVAALAAEGIRPPFIHAANSAGLAFLRPTHTLARPGLLLYGVHPRPLSPAVDVRPVMQVSAPVTALRDIAPGTAVSYGGRFVALRPTRIATVALGYADGVPRTDAMREDGSFVVRGRRAPVAGSVCMDLTMLDVTDVPGVEVGDVAVFLGDEPDAWEVATRAGTIAWEVLAHIGPRVPRVAVAGGQVLDVKGPDLG